MTLDTVYGTEQDAYLELVRRFPLRPLRSDADLDAAVEMVDSLLDQDSLSRAEGDYLDVLGDLIERYESEEHPMPAVSDAEILRHLIEARAVTQARVASETGIVESTISAVLSGKRKLSRKHIGKLAEYFNVPPDVFHFGAA